VPGVASILLFQSTLDAPVVSYNVLFSQSTLDVVEASCKFLFCQSTETTSPLFNVPIEVIRGLLVPGTPTLNDPVITKLPDIIALPVNGNDDPPPADVRAKDAVKAYDDDRAGLVLENIDPVAYEAVRAYVA